MSLSAPFSLQRLWATMLGMALLISVHGFAAAQEATPDPTAAIDGRIDIGGRSLYLHCTGTGSPTILLESALQESSVTWVALQPEIAKTNRVCSYDRAGVGFSDTAVTGTRTISAVAADLYALLAAAKVNGPLVLVGNQLGSNLVTYYASIHPEDVAGLVLVNPQPYTRDEFERYLATLPPGARAQQLAGAHGDNTEGLDFYLSLDEVEAAPAPPLVPILLLAPGLTDADLMPAGWPAEELHVLFRQFQDEQVSSLGAHLVLVEQSNGLIVGHQPEVVLQAIEDVVNAVLNPASWQATPVVAPPGTATPAP